MPKPPGIDNTDWLKTAAIILVTVDHFGYFFIADDQWWSLIGRLAAPPFFFLLGYAHTRTVPLTWVGLGVFLTLLDSWNTDWTWVAPNILLSLALIRIARPNAQVQLQHHGWTAFVILVFGLIALLPIAANVVDYGSEGWLWALFGLCQRMYIDSRSAKDALAAVQSPPACHTRPAPENVQYMRLLACLVAAIVYVWQEQLEFSFSEIRVAVLILGVGILSLSLCMFLRGPSRIQPPEPVAGTLRFVGRRTLEIYVTQLAAFELIIKFVPELAA